MLLYMQAVPQVLLHSTLSDNYYILAAPCNSSMVQIQCQCCALTLSLCTPDRHTIEQQRCNTAQRGHNNRCIQLYFTYLRPLHENACATPFGGKKTYIFPLSLSLLHPSFFLSCTHTHTRTLSSFILPSFSLNFLPIQNFNPFGFI